MTLRISDGLRNFMLQHGSFRQSLHGGKIEIYSGTQPSSSNAAPTGTLLATITKASGTHTNEVVPSGSVTLDTGASGSVDSILVAMPSAASAKIELLDSAVAFNSTLTLTAADVATAINQNLSNPEFTATSSGAVVTISPRRGGGTQMNAWTIVSSCTTITSTDANLSSGVSSANGLTFGVATTGALVKNPDETWTGVAVATGTAGWFRYVGPVADSGAADTAEAQIRLDGSVATSGGDLNLSSTSITSGATQTISGFTVTQPAS